MNIKEVEERTGLRKANIRYYEQEGLLKPKRNAQNNYREYSQEEVETLKRIKLLRMLEISVQKISELQAGKISITELLEEREKQLTEEIRGRQEMKELCRKVKGNATAFDELDVSVLEEKSSYIKMRQEKIRRFDVIDTLENQAALLHKAIIWSICLYWIMNIAHMLTKHTFLPQEVVIVFLILDLGMLACWTGIKWKIHRLKMG